MDLPFKIDVISTNFPRGNSTSNRWRIDEDVSIGKKQLKTYIVSVVQEKAFDKVDREFLYNIMEKLGYSKTFINFI